MRHFAWILAVASAALFAAQPAPRPPMSLCIGDDPSDCAKPIPIPTSGAVKWHPGHYMWTAAYGAIPDSVITEVNSEPNFQGVKHAYYWATLEPERGRYDFSLIEKHLALLKPARKRLIIQVSDRSFVSSGVEGKLPAYLTNEPGGAGGWWRKVDPNTGATRGYIAKVWQPAIMDRYIALWQALAARFDDDPYVEFVVASEISPGTGTHSCPDFTVAAYSAQLKRHFRASKAAFAHTNVAWYTNSFSGQVGDLIKLAYELRMGAGNTDVLKFPGTQGDRILSGAEPGYTIDYRGQIAIPYEAQGPEFGGKEGSLTPAQVFALANDNYHATHLMWVRKTWTPGATWAVNIKPYVRNASHLTYTACPKLLSCNTN